MQKQMSQRLKLGLIVAFLLVVAFVAAFGAYILIQQNLSYLVQHVPPHLVAGDIEFFYVTNALFNTINIALLAVLIGVYVNIYLKTRSIFTVGLLIFAIALIIRDLTSSPFVTSLYGFRATGLGPFAFLPSLFEFVALTVLLYLSAKY